MLLVGKLGTCHIWEGLIQVCNKCLLLVKQSASTIVICVYMGLQKYIKDTTDNMWESQVRALWLWNNDEYKCVRERLKTTPTSSESVCDVRPAPTSVICQINFRVFSGFLGFLGFRKPGNLETCNDNNGVAKIFNLLNNNYNNMTRKCKWGIKSGELNLGQWPLYMS